MIVRPSSMQPATRLAISVSVSGMSTTNGYSTRQSVASVTCETRERPSDLMLSLAVTRERTRTVRFTAKDNIKFDGAELRRERLDRVAREREQLADNGVARRVGRGRAALLDLAEAVVQRFDQLGAAARVDRSAA